MGDGGRQTEHALQTGDDVVVDVMPEAHEGVPLAGRLVVWHAVTFVGSAPLPLLITSWFGGGGLHSYQVPTEERCWMNLGRGGGGAGDTVLPGG